MTNKLRSQAEELAVRPYVVRIIKDDSDPEYPLYVAVNPELDGCIAQGETVQEAEANLNTFRVEYIEHLLVNGLPVPLPTPSATITGILNPDEMFSMQIRLTAGGSEQGGETGETTPESYSVRYDVEVQE